MPDHLIGIGNGVMAISRTFAWWSTCIVCVIWVSAKRSYWQSSSRMHTLSLSLSRRRSWIRNLPDCISAWLRARYATKKCGAERREPRGSAWCRYALVIVFLTTNDKGNFLKLFYHFDTSEVITKMKNTNHQGASAAMEATATHSRSSDLFIYLFIYCT